MLIGFIGAPGCGKSTTAFGLCYRLKAQSQPVEFFAEYARRQIMQCRIDAVPGNGGLTGQKYIYAMDSDNALFYRAHSDAIAITDGSTINCHFYGLDDLDLVAEAQKYDVLFYIPLTKVPVIENDANRMQNTAEVLAMAQRWEAKIRPLMQQCNHIVELHGYPHQTPEQMLDKVCAHLEDKVAAQKHAA